jgi:hypothetical protein
MCLKHDFESEMHFEEEVVDRCKTVIDDTECSTSC